MANPPASAPMPGLFRQLAETIASLGAAWRGRRQARGELNQAIELVVEASGGYVRAERGYRRKLAPVVREVLARAKREVARIPGPVLASRSTWDSDPVVGAIFKDADELEAVIASNANLKNFFRQHRPATACAMITVAHRVKTVLWTEVQGQMLRRDIPRQAVSFDQHNILAPAADEAATRAELVRLYLEYLATQSLEGYLRQEVRDDDLKALLVLAEVKLKSLKAQRHGLHETLRETADLDLQIHKAERQRRELEQEMDQARDRHTALGGHLAVLLAALSHPDNELKVGVLCERLNKFGLRVEDLITAIAGIPVTHWMDLQAPLEAASGEPVEVQVLRGGEAFTVTLTAEFKDYVTERGRWTLGFQPGFPVEEGTEVRLDLGEALAFSAGRVLLFAELTYSFLWKMLTLQLSLQEVGDNVGGPVQIFVMSYQSSTAGLEEFLWFAGLLNVLLAIMNILPIPILDGGHCIINIIESLRRRPIPLPVLERVYALFFALIIALMVTVFAKDILANWWRLTGSGS